MVINKSSIIMIINFTSYINSPYFLFALVSILCTIKISLLVTLIINHTKKNTIAHITLFLLIIIIFGSSLSDISWFLKLARKLFFPNLSYGIVVFSIRISWAFIILQYQALALLIKYLAYKKYKMNYINKLLCMISFVFFSYFFIAAFAKFGDMSEEMRTILVQKNSWFDTDIEVSLMRICVIYLFYLIGVHGIGSIIPLISRSNLPKILYKQISLLLYYLLIPYFIVEILVNINSNIPTFLPFTNLLNAASITFFTAALYYCMKKIMRLRFLNGSGQVELIKRFNFVDDFKHVLEQLGSATSLYELTHISQSLCQSTLSIAPSNVSLHVRSSSRPLDMHKANTPQPIEATIEEFLSTHNSTVCEFIRQHKILVYDELAFSNFYQESHACQTIILFLQKINADIFLPIFDKNKLIAYLIIIKNARPEQLYSKVEQDELIVFSRYLANVIYLIQTCNVDTLLAHEKQLSQELYKREQELNNYKESIHSFLKYTKHKDIGILFYKNRRFTFANQTAKELIKINPNSLEGHVITKTLRYLTAQVQEYRTPKTELISDYEGRKLIFTAVPNLENNSIIITVCYPDIGDLISRKISSLKNPAQWDLLLHLETTKPGNLINRWIPGSGEILLEYKINFLKQSSTLAPITLVIPSADALIAAELIHLIGNRHTFEHIVLTSSDENKSAKNYTPDQFIQLLENCAPNSTLFIENIEYLEPESQNILADIFLHGHCYHPKTTLKVTPECRIICSTILAFEDLMQQALITPALSAQLRNILLIMPSLSTLPFSEFDDLIMALCHQKIKVGALNSLLELSVKDKERIIAFAPSSIVHLKQLVQERLDHKSHDALDTAFDNKDIQEINNPIITHAARLGKNALRDKQVMVELWKLFKNQNKIAAFLGVNRSSVNRRCKEYQLL